MATASRTFELVTSYTVASNETPITLSSIPQIYTDLRVILTGGYTWTDASSSIRVNGDTGSNYLWNYISSGTASSASTGTAGLDTEWNIGWYPYPNTATNRGVVVMDLFNYANTNVYKHFNAITGEPAGNNGLIIQCGTWRSTSAITSITFKHGTYGSPLWVASTNVSIYGIKAAS